MRADVMRNMIECVLQECYVPGLYIPVISFDAKWFSLAIRDSHGKPLTMLQLQKDVYTEAKHKSKNDIVKSMLNANKLNVSEFHNIIEKIDISYTIDDNGKISCPIDVGKLLKRDAYKQSQHIVRLIRAEVQKVKGKKKPSNKAVWHNKDCVNVGGLAELFNAAEINEAERDETPSTSVQGESGNSIENDNCID